jgi:hypothetical protein
VELRLELAVLPPHRPVSPHPQVLPLRVREVTVQQMLVPRLPQAVFQPVLERILLHLLFPRLLPAVLLILEVSPRLLLAQANNI